MEATAWNPGSLLELSGYYWKTCTLHAGVKLGVFTAIGESHLTADAIAGKTGCDRRGMRRLLDALTAMGLLGKNEDAYGNTSESALFLSKQSEKYIGHMIMHHHHLMESWARLDRAVKNGQPQRSRSSFSDPQRRESFLMGMFNMAMNVAPRIIPLIDLGGRRRLLDLGGGPGTYAIFFCQHNPQLKATVFDLPTTRPFAENTIARFDMTDRVAFAAGNFIEDSIQGRFDVVWLSHVLHGEGPDACRLMIEKAVAALEPGGMIIIHDFILEDSMDGPLFPALFSLNMLLATTHGQSYSQKHIKQMLSGAGVRQIRRLRIDSPNDSSLMIGNL